MTIDTWLLYVGTVLILMSTPGPSHLLMLSVSMSNGFRRSLATAAGDLTANTLQILFVGLGLATVVTASQYGFVVIKWAGVSYLVWIGVRQFIASFRKKSRNLNKDPRKFIGTRPESVELRLIFRTRLPSRPWLF